MRSSTRVIAILVLCAPLLIWQSGPDSAAEAPAPKGTAPANPEKWADPNLKVTSGLELWLDVKRLNAARKASQKPDFAPGQKVDVWLDASGNGRNLEQKELKHQPVFFSADKYTAVRFEGSGQRLSRLGDPLEFKQVTVFVVTAPFASPFGSRGFFSMNAKGVSDFFNGLAMNTAPTDPKRCRNINVAGAGMETKNLLTDPFDLATLKHLCITSVPGDEGTKLYVNGKLQGKLKRKDSSIRADQINLGARFMNLGLPPEFKEFLNGDIVEFLVYNRALDDAERVDVETYLKKKHGDGAVPLPPVVGKPRVRVDNPPPVQVFLPGFSVRRLPVELSNINNMQYRNDGKLVALAYDGNAYLLSDTDGDGLEDKAELFWDNKGSIQSPIGMALTPPGYKLGNGLFIACKGKLSLVVDTDGDNVADKEIVVAKGWPGILHNVDALGVAYDAKDGSIYFGLGTTAYTNAYLTDKEGKAKYSLENERGTILRVAPDFKSREIVCTGIRFPVSLAFNKTGDLFCSDQEGATWLSNGNPFDELLYIEKGRHYGFPPRHPRHLPKVIDEPSVFDYAPQHQSTCGLKFDEPVNGGPVFGPPAWQSDALMAGYSRGKLYRTQLVKTPAGYVARNHLLASLNMLTVDSCVSPKGDLVVAVHSGGPDWGSGPTGKGKLYKIAYTGQDLAQPVLAWPQGPQEVRIAFDRPIAADHLKNLVGRTSIEYGRYVSAGDRFEHLAPGYQAVADQADTPRWELPVLGAQMTPDRRTLILSTGLHPEAAGYALTLPGLGRPEKSEAKKDELPQLPVTDLAYDLTGAEAAWQPKSGGSPWTGWLPHLDLTVSRKFTAGSANHDDLWTRVKEPGKLTLRCKLDLWNILRPSVQPGSTIDYEWPEEKVTLAFRAKSAIEVKVAGKAATAAVDKDGAHIVNVTLDPKRDAPIPLEVVLETGAGDLDLSLSYHTNEDQRPRALSLLRTYVPWAELKKQVTKIAQRDIPELKGGNWSRGRKLYFGEQAGCFKCHNFGGQGGAIGPELSNLPQRDYHSVLRDVTEPSFAINPDYITRILELRDGRVLTGTIRTEGEVLHVADNQGKVTIVNRKDVEEMKSSPLSTMPEGLPKQLGPEKIRDLLTFLLTDPPRMTDYGKGTPPAPRSMKEVKAVLAGAPEPAPKTRPIHVVLVAGRKDHGPGEHDYPAWVKTWPRLLSLAEDMKVTTAMEWPEADDLKSADVLVFYQQGKWTPERAKDIDAVLARGCGLVYIHYAVDGGTDAPGFAQRIGLAWKGGASRFRHGPLDLGFETGARHPIGRNFAKVHFHDESYWQLVGDPKKIDLLASGMEDGKPQPLFWTLEPDKGRVFVSIPGHFSWTFDDPLFRVLLLRAIAWTAREPVDRFNDLATVGARVVE